MSISDYLENELLDAVFNNGSFAVAQPWVSLHDGDPGEDGANEVNGGSYARQSGSFGAAASGAVANDADIEFADMPTVTVTHVGVFDAETDGNFLWGGALTASKALTSGDTARIATGELDVTLD